MPIKTITVERPLLKTRCTLGEGPLYEHRGTSSLLHFVDIVEKKVFHLDLETQRLDVEQFDDSVTCLALRENGLGLACAAARGFATIENSKLTYVAKPIAAENQHYTRFNDGGCDAKGRFFAGTIFSSDNPYIPGMLYRYDPEDGSCQVVDEGPFTDSNGMGWSLDQKTFYFTDSLVNIIYAYDYEDGKLSNRRVFVDALSLGLPQQTFCDGLCVDEAGGVWCARWGGSRIVRFTAGGVLDLQVVFPTALNITACCFGGPENDQLFVTSAHCGAIGGDPARQQQYPDSGDLFVVDLDGQYRGVARHKFRG
ncbi:hypothetical protein C8J56DRAFT_308866 [Mycena floridula]|nr:hypothetical protein C8J56DRAFT_308866 [Mycena floridula]